VVKKLGLVKGQIEGRNVDRKRKKPRETVHLVSALTGFIDDHSLCIFRDVRGRGLQV
jgi:hypothetical protein